MPFATEVGIHHRLFGGNNFIYSFKKLPLVESFFNVTQEKEITERKKCPKILQITENLRETVPFSLTLQSCSPGYLNIRKKFFSGDVAKTAHKKVLKNHQKNVFSSVHFKIFKLSNPPTYNYRKTDSAPNISFVSFENFKIGLRANFRFPKVVLKLTEKFPGSNLWWGFLTEIYKPAKSSFKSCVFLKLLR